MPGEKLGSWGHLVRHLSRKLFEIENLVLWQFCPLFYVKTVTDTLAYVCHNGQLVAVKVISKKLYLTFNFNDILNRYTVIIVYKNYNKCN